MLEVSASKSVAASPERVWALLCDTTRYAEWVKATAEVTRTDGPAAEGGTYDELNPVAGPWKARTSWVIEEFEAPRRQLHASEDLPLSSRFEVIMEVAPEGDGALATVTLRSIPSHGPLGAAFERVMRGMVAADNRKTVDALAALAAREQAASAPA